MIAVKAEVSIVGLVLIAGCASAHESAENGDAGAPRELTFEQVSVYRDTSCALRSDGLAACWGYAFPGEPLIREGPFDKVAAGSEHACFLREGKVDCIPAPFAADLNNHSDVPSGSYTDVVTGTAWSCALRPDGRAPCWGNRGPGPFVPDTALATIEVGPYSACGLTGDDEPLCWQPGDESEEHDIEVTAGRLVALAMISTAICGIEPGGNVRCWYEEDSRTEAVFGTPPPGPFEVVSLDNSEACALRPDGEAVCWGSGYEDFGHLEPEGLRYRQLEVGREHACGITLDGELVCWGSNECPLEGRWEPSDCDQATPPELPAP